MPWFLLFLAKESIKRNNVSFYTAFYYICYSCFIFEKGNFYKRQCSFAHNNSDWFLSSATVRALVISFTPGNGSSFESI